MTKKNITGWLVIDWKSGSHRSRATKPNTSELGTNEVLGKLNIDVVIPDVDVPELALTVDAPEPQVHAATLDALDDDARPDWTTAAADIVSDRQDELASADTDGGVSFSQVIDSVTLQVVKEAPGRPQPDDVREYVAELAYNAVREDGDD